MTGCGRAGGFTLVEIMAAMAIFLMGIVGILALLTAGVGLHKEAVDRSTVAMAADEVLELVHARMSGGLERDPETGLLLPLGEQPVPGRKGYTYSVSFTESTLLEEGSPVQARVSIAWMSRGRRRVADYYAFVQAARSFAEEVRKARSAR